MLKDLIDLAELEASQRDIQLISHLLPGVRVLGHPEQLKRLFANLLNNALYYTPAKGTVLVSVQCFANTATIDIEDTGMGIASDSLSSIFERFWRSEEARAGRKNGSGLGLAIAQSIAQAHGGRIEVTSQLGIGSRFRVRLPSSASLI
jgi:signal transduction histidine kinase